MNIFVAGADYTSLSNHQMNFTNGGNTFHTFTVDIIPDQRSEIKEFFEVVISEFTVLNSTTRSVMPLTSWEQESVKIAFNHARVEIIDSSSMSKINSLWLKA